MSQSDFVTRGQSLVAAGQFQEAVKVCRLGLLGRPTTVEGRIVLGQALLALKRFDEVLAEMRVALELDHTSMIAQTLKCEALLRKGDHHGAIELLQQLRTQYPTEIRIAQLLDEAHRASGRPPKSASHPSVGFLGGTAESTKHYPNHQSQAEANLVDLNGDEDSGGGYTRPTSLATPVAKTPSPKVLAIGDHSGTVEVDPELDGVELDGDDDFGTLAAPPAARGRAPNLEEARGSVKRSSGAPQAAKKANLPMPRSSGDQPPFAPRAHKKPKEATSVELDSDELMEVNEFEPDPPTPYHKPGPSTKVRSAVNIAPGQFAEPAPSPAATRPTAQAQPAIDGPQLAGLLAGQPHVMQQMQAAPPRQRMPIAAALPTAAAMPYPPAPRPVLDAHGQPIVDALFGGQVAPAPAWAKATVAAQPVAPHYFQDPAHAPPQHADQPLAHPPAQHPAMNPNSRAMGVDPAMQALLDSMEQPGAGPVMVVEPTNSSASRPMKTGIRKGRSRFQIVMWIFIGGLVIGGGVFAGFQIRAMRLAKQIDAARANAVDNAKADTWRGWLAARDSLGGIAQAASTVENRAALARARGVLAFEFGEGVPEAKLAIDNLGDKGGLDAALGAAYVALARNEPKAAKLAIERATAIEPEAPETLYVSGQLALLVGEIKTAQQQLQAAVAKAPRALYYVGLARANASVSAWDDAVAAVDKALELSPEHPGALIERARLLVASGRLAQRGADVRKQLEKLLVEGGKSIAEQPRGVSPLQLTFTQLALAQVAFAMADPTALDLHLNAAVKINIEDPRFAELISETVLMAGTIRQGNLYAEKAALATLAGSPSSRRAMVVLAESLLVQGKAGDALDYLLGKGTDATSLPRGMAVRGHVKLALDDVAGARADFEAVEKIAPKLELAVIGLAMVDLASDDAEAALGRLEKAYKPTAATLAMTLAYASALRATRDPASRDKARSLLDKLVPVAIGIDAPLVQLELGRVSVDLGLVAQAKQAFAEVAKSPNVDLRLQAALYMIEEQDAVGGRAAIEAILKTLEDASRKPSGRLLVEAARARMLVGDHAGAEGLLTQAENAKATPWRVDRERARLRFRKGDTTGAAEKLLTAIETSGADLETLLLAADVVYVDLATQENKLAALADKLRTAVATHIKELPEAAIIEGKLALAVGKNAEAETLYTTARAAFEKDKVVSRRSAQAHFGLAVVEYNRESLTTAKDKLDLVVAQDPTLYDAFLFQADLMLRTKDLKKALEKAKQATTLNGDSVQGWHLIGLIAAAQTNRKLLTEAATRVNALAPDSGELKELQALLAR